MDTRRNQSLGLPTVAPVVTVAGWRRPSSWVAIAVDYRVRSRHNTTPLDAVRDAKSSMRWVRQHANRLGIDPSRIAAAGGSAGDP